MKKSERLVRCSDLLQTFVTVAECGNVTRASNTLGRTQSAISIQLKKLEETLEVQLFERQARGMMLTENGEKLLPVARKIVADLVGIDDLFSEPLQGRLCVGIPDDFADAVLEHVLVNFSQRHPDVEVSARFGCTSRFPEDVRKGELDLAVVSGSQAEDAIPIAAERNVWAAHRSLSLSKDATVPLAILDRDGCSWRRFGSDTLTSSGRKWRLAYASESFAGVKAAIRSGLAVGVLPYALLGPNMKQMTDRDGFPRLPSTTRGIVTSPHSEPHLCDAMVQAILAAAAGRTTTSQAETATA